MLLFLILLLISFLFKKKLIKEELSMSKCEAVPKIEKKENVIVPIKITAKKKRRLYVKPRRMGRACKGLVRVDKNCKLVIVPPPRPVNVHIEHKKRD